MQYSIQRSAVGIQPNLFTAKDAKDAKEKEFKIEKLCLPRSAGNVPVRLMRM
jgi:hypothetical protein